MGSPAARIPFQRAWFWEFLQNLPLFLAFTYGYARNSAGDLPGAAVSVFTGCLAAALLIRWTENRIRPGFVEAASVSLMNIFFFSAATILFVIYFSWKGGGPLLDLPLGLAAGAGASILQSRAGGEKVHGRHTVSLAAAAALTVLCIRFFVLSLSPLPGALLLNVPVTSLIVLIEYRE